MHLTRAILVSFLTVLAGCSARDWPAFTEMRDPLHITDTEVLRMESDGSVRWRIGVPWAKGARIAPSRDFILGASELIAVDDVTGAVVWRVPSDGWVLEADGDGIVTSRGKFFDTPGELVGHAFADGAVLFRAPLTTLDHGELLLSRHLVLAGSLFGQTQLFDRNGRGIRTEPDPISTQYPIGDDLLVLSGESVALLGPTGEARWRSPWRGGWAVHVVELGDELIIGRYGPISDSGVNLRRIRTSDGLTRWSHYACALGVSHSEYSHHTQLVPRADALYVLSRGSYGDFDEALDPATGELLERRQSR